MAPRQTKASRVHAQRAQQPRKSLAGKEAVRQARQRIVTRRVTKTGSKVAFKL